jgi:hypothetical protein
MARKVRFRVSRGYNGTIIRAGAVVEVNDFWFDVFTKDGTAVEVAEVNPENVVGDRTDANSPPPPTKKGKKK